MPMFRSVGFSTFETDKQTTPLFGVRGTLLSRHLGLSSTLTANLREVLGVPRVDPMCRRALSTYALQARASTGTVVV